MRRLAHDNTRPGHVHDILVQMQKQTVVQEEAVDGNVQPDVIMKEPVQLTPEEVVG